MIEVHIPATKEGPLRERVRAAAPRPAGTCQNRAATASRGQSKAEFTLSEPAAGGDELTGN